MLLRRSLLTSAAACLVLAAPAAGAATPRTQAAKFIETLGQQLVGIVDAASSTSQQDAQMQRIIDRSVDVDGIAKFCLGRYWRTASAAQRKEYEGLFRKVLMISITARLGQYKGVGFAVGRTTSRPEGEVVSTTITRPGKAPATVDWVVKDVGGQPKIVDVVAEGTSLRLTQRDDYNSFIAQHNQSVQALIDALRKQVSQNA